MPRDGSDLVISGPAARIAREFADFIAAGGINQYRLFPYISVCSRPPWRIFTYYRRGLRNAGAIAWNEGSKQRIAAGCVQ
jgi:hypothetical protein